MSIRPLLVSCAGLLLVLAGGPPLAWGQQKKRPGPDARVSAPARPWVSPKTRINKQLKPAPAAKKKITPGKKPVAPASRPGKKPGALARTRSRRRPLSKKDLEVIKNMELLQNLELLEAMDLLMDTRKKKK